MIYKAPVSERIRAHKKESGRIRKNQGACKDLICVLDLKSSEAKLCSQRIINYWLFLCCFELSGLTHFRYTKHLQFLFRFITKKFRINL